MSALAQTAMAIAGGAAAIGTGLVFIGTGMAKLRHRALFPGVVANYRLLPEPLIRPVALVLPPLELAVGAGLLAGWRWAAAPAIALLVLFALAMAINIARGRGHIDCGCGRPDLRQPLNRVLVWRNVVLAALLVPALAAIPDFASAPWLVALAGGLALYALTLLANALAALATGPLAAVKGNAR